ncbi:hypothetical protein ACVPOR_15755 [Staphylococcus aureus]
MKSTREAYDYFEKAGVARKISHSNILERAHLNSYILYLLVV